jgi:uncharacterized protein with HEPN domain
VRDDTERLLDILEAIERVEKYTASGRASFDADELVQTWVVHHLQIIGEAARHISMELRDRHPDIRWPDIIAMRNILVHEYFELDQEELWATAQRDLPELKAKVEAVLRERQSDC